MCGIAGLIQFGDRSPDARRVEAMLKQVRHRGPDGEGIEAMGMCVMAHARLSIIDIADGTQPMTAPKNFEHEALTVVFNGEIYNHRDLRDQLERFGHRFRTDHSDTEVLLHAYRQWGDAMVSRLSGMFAFAIFDHDDRSLLLARDRTGKKPLYFATQGDTFLFGSLVGAVVAGMEGDVPAIDADAMLMFLRLGYTGSQSIFAGVEELPPGCMVRVSATERDVHRYWGVPPRSSNTTDKGLVRGMTELLDQAVGLRLEADVPLGCFLSGGIDSSVVAALAQRQLEKRGGDALRTFSVAMPVMAFDESEHAKVVADHIGATHTRLEATPNAGVLEDLDHLTGVWGEPTADSSVLPTYWLSRATREHVKVALSGDGGDETFGGYDRYRAMRLIDKYRWWLRRLPRGSLQTTDPRATRTRLGRLVDAAARSEPPRQYQQMIHLFTDHQIRELAADLVGGADRLAQNTPPVPDWSDTGDAVHDAMQWDFMHYLRFDLHRKVDRASMAVALEVRCPLMDRHVVDLTCHLPHQVLMPGGRPKGLLRDVAAQFVPASIVERPKRGFALPLGDWFRGELREGLWDRLTDGTLTELGCNQGVATQLFDAHVEHRADHTHRLFALLSLTSWQRWRKALGAKAP